jgi:hypothetical protein
MRGEADDDYTPEELATRAQLDTALRAHAANHLKEGEIIVAWIALAAIVGPSGGGYVVNMPSNGVMPTWQARGILAESGSDLDATYDSDS